MGSTDMVAMNEKEDLCKDVPEKDRPLLDIMFPEAKQFESITGKMNLVDFCREVVKLRAKVVRQTRTGKKDNSSSTASSGGKQKVDRSHDRVVQQYDKYGTPIECINMREVLRRRERGEVRFPFDLVWG